MHACAIWCVTELDDNTAPCREEGRQVGGVGLPVKHGLHIVRQLLPEVGMLRPLWHVPCAADGVTHNSNDVARMTDRCRLSSGSAQRRAGGLCYRQQRRCGGPAASATTLVRRGAAPHTGLPRGPMQTHGRRCRTKQCLRVMIHSCVQSVCRSMPRHTQRTGRPRHAASSLGATSPGIQAPLQTCCERGSLWC